MNLSQMFMAVLAVAACAAGGADARLGTAGLSVEKNFLPEHAGRVLAQFGSLGGDVGKSMGSCSDPYVQAMVAADNADRGGIGAFKCDEAMSQIAMEHSKAMCKCDPPSPISRFSKETVACSVEHPVSVYFGCWANTFSPILKYALLNGAASIVVNTPVECHQRYTEHGASR